MSGAPSTLTATFLFTDIQGSTTLLAHLGEERYARLLEDHRALIRRAVATAGGLEVDTQGDGFFLVFSTPSQAVSAAVAVQSSLHAWTWPEGVELRVRMGVHTGEAVVSDGRYVGMDVHRAARIAAAGHGGQVLVSGTTRTLVEHRLPDGVALKELGHHRLKDLAHPEHLFQLLVPGLASVFPPLRSLESRLGNLPHQLTSFVGRGRERQEVRRLLSEARLLTLTGPGGTGKSRLALEVGRDLVTDFPDGVFFVALNPLRDPDLVAPSIAGVLGVPSVDGPVLDALKDHLAPRRALLILDGFEHLLPAGLVVRELLQAAEHLRILVTSRARLHLSGEQELPVPPLDLPGADTGPDDASQCEALALLAQRARAADPGFALSADNFAAAAEVCVRLDGLPLAIELAAARLNVLTPELLLQRLERCLPELAAGPFDLPDRQRTLRGTIAWSYDLLGPSEQALFRRLSVFSGGCSIAAVQAVAGGDQGEVLEGLSSLVEKSLLRRIRDGAARPRFSMLETIREFAYEELVNCGEAREMEDRHARFYLDLVAGTEGQLTKGGGDQSAGVLQRDLDNLRAVMRRCARKGDAETGLQVASLLWRFWQQRGQLDEGRQWMERLLSLPGATPRTTTRAKALGAAAGIAYWQGDYDRARACYEENLSICEELADTLGTAEALYSLAYVAGTSGDYEGAHRLHRQSMAMAEAGGDLCCVASNLVGGGMISLVEGDAEAARTDFEKARALFEELEEGYGLATVLCLLSRVAVDAGDVEGAQGLWRRAFRLLVDLGDASGTIIALSDRCAIELARGRPEAAVRLAGAADGLGESLKVRPPKALTQPPDPRPVARGELGDEVVEAAWRMGRAMTLEEAIAYATQLSDVDATVGEKG